LRFRPPPGTAEPSGGRAALRTGGRPGSNGRPPRQVRRRRRWHRWQPLASCELGRLHVRSAVMSVGARCHLDQPVDLTLGAFNGRGQEGEVVGVAKERSQALFAVAVTDASAQQEAVVSRGECGPKHPVQQQHEEERRKRRDPVGSKDERRAALNTESKAFRKSTKTMIRVDWRMRASSMTRRSARMCHCTALRPKSVLLVPQAIEQQPVEELRDAGHQRDPAVVFFPRCPCLLRDRHYVRDGPLRSSSDVGILHFALVSKRADEGAVQKRNVHCRKLMNAHLQSQFLKLLHQRPHQLLRNRFKEGHFKRQLIADGGQAAFVHHARRSANSVESGHAKNAAGLRVDEPVTQSISCKNHNTHLRRRLLSIAHTPLVGGGHKQLSVRPEAARRHVGHRHGDLADHLATLRVQAQNPRAVKAGHPQPPICIHSQTPKPLLSETPVSIVLMEPPKSRPNRLPAFGFIMAPAFVSRLIVPARRRPAGSHLASLNLRKFRHSSLRGTILAVQLIADGGQAAFVHHAGRSANSVQSGHAEDAAGLRAQNPRAEEAGHPQPPVCIHSQTVRHAQLLLLGQLREVDSNSPIRDAEPFSVPVVGVDDSSERSLDGAVQVKAEQAASFRLHQHGGLLLPAHRAGQEAASRSHLASLNLSNGDDEADTAALLFGHLDGAVVIIRLTPQSGHAEDAAGLRVGRRSFTFDMRPASTQLVRTQKPQIHELTHLRRRLLSLAHTPVVGGGHKQLSVRPKAAGGHVGHRHGDLADHLPTLRVQAQNPRAEEAGHPQPPICVHSQTVRHAELLLLGQLREVDGNSPIRDAERLSVPVAHRAGQEASGRVAFGVVESAEVSKGCMDTLVQRLRGHCPPQRRSAQAIYAGLVFAPLTWMPHRMQSSTTSCYLRLEANSVPLGRLEFRLFATKVPLTCRNFASLCVGHENGCSGYRGSRVHRCIPGFAIQAGDFQSGNGTGGWSIYGRYFPDEDLTGRHDRRGLLSMANSGPDTNSSQFLITLAPCPWMDGRHVVFGELTSGWDVLQRAEDLGTPSGRPTKLLAYCRLRSVVIATGRPVQKFPNLSYLYCRYCENKLI
uniref:peptidylprolyl isomerase n=1 Tax=Macrostomum lignano TaxID=282301 RepID=A0A1I8HXI8_9PLAT